MSFKVPYISVAGNWVSSNFETNNLPFCNFINITQEVASNILKNHSQKNRNLDRRRIERYKLAMLANRWRYSNDDICFDKDGKLQNGYHRLTALSELKGMSIRMSLKFGMPVESVESMDEGRPRSLSNIASMMGDNPSVLGLRGSAYLLEASGDKPLMGREIQREFYLKHKNVFDKVSSVLHKDMARGPVVAAISRAVIHFKGVQKNSNAVAEIYNFAQAISTINYRGPNPSNSSVKLREYIIRHTNGRQDGSQRTDMYLKTLSSIQNFLAQRSVDRLSAAAANVYPIPEESGGARIVESIYRSLGGNIKNFEAVRKRPEVVETTDSVVVKNKKKVLAKK